MVVLKTDIVDDMFRSNNTTEFNEDNEDQKSLDKKWKELKDSTRTIE